MARRRKMTPERREFINGLLEHYQPTDAQDVQAWNPARQGHPRVHPQGTGRRAEFVSSWFLFLSQNLFGYGLDPHLFFM